MDILDSLETGTSSSSSSRAWASRALASDSSTCAAGSSSSHSDVHAHEAVLFPFIAVFIGCIITYGTARSRWFRIMPYTVWLFLIGIFLGLVNYESGKRLGNLSESMDMWMNIDPHVLLYTFLPVLLFGDSMNINWHDFIRCAAQCTILAGPGVLMGTGMMYVLCKLIFPYDWTTNEAAAFASILAATDPVAVVALLNEMGASRTLTMQIAGESLLNDGMAIVVWTMFDDMMLGTEYSAGDIVGKFCRLAIGGVVFGILVGFITLRGLALASDKLIHTDHLVQLALTFIAAYLAFFIGENELKVSGVLATIFAALVLGKAAWPLICSREAVTHVWHTAEFFGNTILFMLCGMVFFQSSINVNAVDWLWLLLLYVCAVVGRGLMILILFPLLNIVATSRTAKMSWRECAVMTWGGLRGAVGLALALSMRGQLRSCGKGGTGDLMVFFVGGFAGLTLLINATTCGFLLAKLELTKPPDVRKKLLGQLQEELLEIARHQCHDLTQNDRRFKACDVDELDRLLCEQLHHCHHVNEHVQNGHNGVHHSATERLDKKAPANGNGEIKQPLEEKRAYGSISDGMDDEKLPELSEAALTHWWWGFEPINMEPLQKHASAVVIKDRDKLEERHFYLSMLRAQYGKQLREDMIPVHAQGSIDLPSSIDRSHDYSHEKLKDWEQLHKHMMQRTDSMFLDVLRRAYSSPYCQYAPIETMDAQDRRYAFDLFSVVVFLDAHHLVCSRLASEKSLHSAARSAVVVEAGQEVEEAHQFLIGNKVGKDEIVIVRTKQILAVIYSRQLKQVNKWMDRGIINHGEAEELIHPVHHSMKQVKNLQKLGTGDEADEPKKNSLLSGGGGAMARLLGKESKKMLDTE